jgi:hypothetical protein
VDMICHKLQVGACLSLIEPLSRDWHSDSLSLQALLMEIGSHKLFKIQVFGSPNIQVSQNVVKSA